MFWRATYKPLIGLSRGPLWLQPYEALYVCVCVCLVQGAVQHSTQFSSLFHDAGHSAQSSSDRGPETRVDLEIWEVWP